MSANKLPLHSHTFNPANDTEIIQWLVQYNNDELPPTSKSFKLNPIQSSLGMSWIIVCLANLACDFQLKVNDYTNDDRNGLVALSVKFTKQEHLRFQKLQSDYHNKRYHRLRENLGCDCNTAASMAGGNINSQGLFEPPPLLTLSPRMMIENENERVSMKHVFIEYLNRQAKEAEMGLLRDLEADEMKVRKKLSKKEKKQLKQLKENKPGENVNFKKDLTDESKKRVGCQEQSTQDETSGIEPMKINSEIAIGKEVPKAGLTIEVPKSNDILAHLMIPLKIDYEDRVSETALPNPVLELRADASRQPILEQLNLLQTDCANSEVTSLRTENESLKAENAKVRREFGAAHQKYTEAIQRVQLKAYIAETARDSAQERAALLERLLLEVIDGKVGGEELDEIFLGLKAQTSPVAVSLLSSLLDRLPRDTLISINSTEGENQNQIQQELQNYTGVLSRLRRGDNMKLND
ncbi:hypothetical protein ACHAW6_014277 [Cyclotella cf. meneghiniana]